MCYTEKWKYGSVIILGGDDIGYHKNEISKEQLEFSVFCVESVADNLSLKGDKVYELLARKSHILENYIIPNFEVLHSQSKDYIVDDIVTYMREEGLVE